MPKKKEAIREYKIDGRIFISGPHKRKMTIEVKEGEKTDIILMRLNQSLRRLMYQLGLDWRGQMGWCKNPACHKAVFLEGWKIAKIMREKEKRLGQCCSPHCSNVAYPRRPKGKAIFIR